MFSWCFGCHIDLKYSFIEINIEIQWRRPKHEGIYLYSVSANASTYPVDALTPPNLAWPAKHIHVMHQIGS